MDINQDLTNSEYNFTSVEPKKYKMKWLVIGTTQAPKMGFTDRQIIKTLESMDIEVFYVDVGDMQYKLIPILNNNEIHTIYWESLNGWKAWNVIQKVSCRKINTWFDDPIMRLDMVDVDLYSKMRDATAPVGHYSNVPAQYKYPVKIFTWDNYWNNRLLMDYGIDSNSFHLAANPKEYYTSTIACENKPIFIGGLHSPEKIAAMQARCCEPFITIIDSIREELKTMPNIPSWDQMEGHYLGIMGEGDQRLFKELCQTDKKMQALFRQCIWALSKNEVRIRMLREAIKVSPIKMFSETSGINHANEDEVKYMVGDGDNRIEFCDTTGISQEHLPMFYHYGWIHLQATDPQSVEEGYSYRIFQTMAAGKALLTDVKPGMKKQFDMESSMVGYTSMEEFKEKLNDLLKNKNRCKEIGTCAREDFEKNHTWEKRLTPWTL